MRTPSTFVKVEPGIERAFAGQYSDKLNAFLVNAGASGNGGTVSTVSFGGFPPSSGGWIPANGHMICNPLYDSRTGRYHFYFVAS